MSINTHSEYFGIGMLNHGGKLMLLFLWLEIQGWDILMVIGKAGTEWHHVSKEAGRQRLYVNGSGLARHG